MHYDLSYTTISCVAYFSTNYPDCYFLLISLSIGIISTQLIFVVSHTSRITVRQHNKTLQQHDTYKAKDERTMI